MEQETFFLERKYKKFTENMKTSLKKAVYSNNLELADAINNYLETIKELEAVNTLNTKNTDEVYTKDLIYFENKLISLQKKIISIQYYNSSYYNEDKIIFDIPNFEEDNMKYIFMFIYKFIKINNKSICIILKNIVDDLFNITFNNINYDDNVEPCNVLNNISIVYNKKLGKIEYIYNLDTTIGNNDKKKNLKNFKKLLDDFLEKLNNLSIDTFIKKEQKKTNDIEKLIDKNDEFDDSNNIIIEPIQDVENYNLDNSNTYDFNNKTMKEFKITLAILFINLLKESNCSTKIDLNDGIEMYKIDKRIIKEIIKKTDLHFLNLRNSYNDEVRNSYKIYKKRSTPIDKKNEYTKQYEEILNETYNVLNKNEKKKYTIQYYKSTGTYINKISKTKLKSKLCDYLTINPKFNIEKEYNDLYNYFLTRNLNTEFSEQKKTEDNDLNIIIPHLSVSLINNSVILFYIFIKNNKQNICNNFLKLLKRIRNDIVKQTYSTQDNGIYYYSNNKIISLCSNNVNAHKLINTFYLKYKEYDKILISNLLLKIINANSMKIKYDMVDDKFSIVIINENNLDFDITQKDMSNILTRNMTK